MKTQLFFLLLNRSCQQLPIRVFYLNMVKYCKQIHFLLKIVLISSELFVLQGEKNFLELASLNFYLGYRGHTNQKPALENMKFQ